MRIWRSCNFYICFMNLSFFSKKLIFVMFFACSLMNAFAQGEYEKPAVYLWKATVYAQGASDAGINKSLASKLLSAIAQSGKYAEIADWEAFYKELSKTPDVGASQIAQAAVQHGADVVCMVNMTEAFGAYSISARMMKASDSQVLKSVSLDRSLNSLDDLTIVSNELAAQLLGLPQPVPPALPPTAAFLEPAPLAPVAAAPAPQVPQVPPAPQNECTGKFNINELVSKIQSGFPASLKDCSSTLAKDIALSKSPFGKKTPLKEPKAFMLDCTIDGVKQKLPSGADEYIKPVENFIQNILNAASGAGGLDVAKLSSAIGGMNVMDLINELKTKAANDMCAVDELYTPPFEDDGGGGSDDEEERSILSFGLRIGFNLSHLEARYSNSNSYGKTASYNSTPGFQFGMLLDIAPSSWFHIQPGVTYIQKGAEDNDNNIITFHYIQTPLLISLKFSVLRLNSGPYYAACVSSSGGLGSCNDTDFGLITGVGFDIGMFYIGAFYDYSFEDSYRYYSSTRYGYTEITGRNSTIGFDFGINL